MSWPKVSLLAGLLSHSPQCHNGLAPSRSGHERLCRSMPRGDSWSGKWEGCRYLRPQLPASKTLSQSRLRHRAVQDPCADSSSVPRWWLLPQQQRWYCYLGVFWTRRQVVSPFWKWRLMTPAAPTLSLILDPSVWIGLDLFNDDTCPSGHISRPTLVNVSQGCLNSLNNYSGLIILSTSGSVSVDFIVRSLSNTLWIWPLPLLLWSYICSPLQWDCVSSDCIHAFLAERLVSSGGRLFLRQSLPRPWLPLRWDQWVVPGVGHSSFSIRPRTMQISCVWVEFM